MVARLDLLFRRADSMRKSTSIQPRTNRLKLDECYAQALVVRRRVRRAANHSRPSGTARRGRTSVHFQGANFWHPNFGRSILGCICTNVCQQKIILQHLSRLTRFACCCTMFSSELSGLFFHVFFPIWDSNFCTAQNSYIFQNFCDKLTIFVKP